MKSPIDNLRHLTDVGLPCARCTVKHLRALAAYLVQHRTATFSRFDMFLSRALVAYTEFIEGYAYHGDYVCGLLVQAEDAAVADGMPEYARDVRTIRTGMEDTHRLNPLELLGMGASYAVGHALEAARESPPEFSEDVISLSSRITMGMVDPADAVREAIRLSSLVDGTIFRTDGVSSEAVQAPEPHGES